MSITIKNNDPPEPEIKMGATFREDPYKFHVVAKSLIGDKLSLITFWYPYPGGKVEEVTVHIKPIDHTWEIPRDWVPVNITITTDKSSP